MAQHLPAVAVLARAQVGHSKAHLEQGCSHGGGVRLQDVRCSLCKPAHCVCGCLLPPPLRRFQACTSKKAVACRARQGQNLPQDDPLQVCRATAGWPMKYWNQQKERGQPPASPLVAGQALQAGSLEHAGAASLQ